MKHIISFISALLPIFLYSQEGIYSSGGTAKGSAGNSAYVIGQFSNNHSQSSAGTISEGILQVYEVSPKTNIEDSEVVEYSISPNPTSSMLTISQKNTSNSLSIKIYTVSGMLCQTHKMNSDKLVLNLETLPASIYFLEISKNNKTLKKVKIIKN